MLENIFNFVLDNQLIIAFFTPILNVDVSVHLLGVLSSGDLFLASLSFLVASLALVLFDLLIFILLRIDFGIGFINRFRNFLKYKVTGEKRFLSEKISELSEWQIIVIILFSKMLPGSRVVTVIYAGISDLRVNLFFYPAILGILLWNIVLISSGFYIGVGLLEISSENFLKNLTLYVLLFVLVVILFTSLFKYLFDLFARKKKWL